MPDQQTLTPDPVDRVLDRVEEQLYSARTLRLNGGSQHEIERAVHSALAGLHQALAALQQS